MQQINIDFVVETPGKVILYGEHSVVYGKTALAASLDLKTSLKFTNNVDVVAPCIILDLPCLKCRQEFFIQDLNELLMQPLPLAAGKKQASFNLHNPEILDFETLLEIAKTYMETKLSVSSFPQENAILSFLCLYLGMFSSIDLFVESFEITITSDLNIGAGMGSSTAYNISLAAAFLQYIRRRLLQHLDNPMTISKEGYKSFSYWSTDLKTFESRELELISHWGHLGDRIMHGNPSGIDNAVCTYGSVIEFTKRSGNPKISVIPNPKYLKILLVNTNIPRNTKKLVNSVAARRDRFMSIIDPILQAMDSVALAAAAALRRLSQIAENIGLEGFKKLEDAVKQEIIKLEELVDINQHLLQSLGVSHEALDHICRIAQIEGLHAKLTGAGGGGYAFVLLPNEGCERKVSAIKMSLARHHFPAQQVNLGGPGVTLRETLEFGDEYVPRGSIFSEILPDFKLSYNKIAYPVCENREEVGKKKKREEEDDETDEWPWPFDLNEVVRTMLQDQIRRDLDCDEIAVPLKQLCAASVPEPLPKWMSEIDYFRKKIAPVWRNTVVKALTHKWKKPSHEKKKSKKSIADSSTNLLINYSRPVTYLPQRGPPRRVSSVIPARKFRFENTPSGSNWFQSNKIPPRSKQTVSLISYHEPEYVKDLSYVVPKQSLGKPKLFPKERNPASWLIGKFPPYGDRKWSCDSDVMEEAKMQLDSVNMMHKKFLKQQKAGCEYLGSLMSKLPSTHHHQAYAQKDQETLNNKYKSILGYSFN